MKQAILNLFNNSSLLDKDCLKDGIKHIQHSILVDRKDIKWIDAAYIGTDGKLYFTITDNNGETKSVLYECMNISDVYYWYNTLALKFNIQTTAASKAEKFIVIKTIGKYGNFIVREFDDEESAKSFVSLMRESEQYDFVRYRITKVLNY